MYTITYEKATLLSTWLQPTSGCGSASTRVQLRFIKRQFGADTRNPSWTRIQPWFMLQCGRAFILMKLWYQLLYHCKVTAAVCCTLVIHCRLCFKICVHYNRYWGLVTSDQCCAWSCSLAVSWSGTGNTISWVGDDRTGWIWWHYALFDESVKDLAERFLRWTYDGCTILVNPENCSEEYWRECISWYYTNWRWVDHYMFVFVSAYKFMCSSNFYIELVHTINQLLVIMSLYATSFQRTAEVRTKSNTGENASGCIWWPGVYSMWLKIAQATSCFSNWKLLIIRLR